ncbi:MAG: hypothetical protein HQ519_03270 [Planctomycetes bacterium]|nr:hypothetical protein [Planctomycetota bacterium]
MRLTLPIFLSAAFFIGFTSYGSAQEDGYVTIKEFDDAMQEIDSMNSQLSRLNPGSTNFLLSGFATAGFIDSPGANSTFAASFSPVFLWTLSDRILFESEMELDFDGESELEFAQINYVVADTLTIGAGKFLSPFGVFTERIHPSWINRLPNAPFIAGHGGLSPNTILGAQARGAVAVGHGKVNYALFVGNGGQLNDGSEEEDEAGLLHWDSIADVDQNKTVGGRVGWMISPGIEIGASILSGKVAADGTSEADVDVDLIGVDFSMQHEINQLNGSLRFDGEYVASSVSDAIYFPGTADALTFTNDRSGGYGQLAFRPTKSESELLRNTEIVTRYDWLDLPSGAPEDETHSRWTFGLDYWLGPSTVLKLAMDQLEIGDEPTTSTFYLQIAIGF